MTYCLRPLADKVAKSILPSKPPILKCEGVDCQHLSDGVKPLQQRNYQESVCKNSDASWLKTILASIDKRSYF